MAQASDATLQDELTLLGSLIELMKQEQQFLIAADTDGLGKITPLKTELVEQLGALASLRHQSLVAGGLAGSEQGMQMWVDGKADRALSATWSRVLDSTREAKELNRVNGMLINKQMMNNQILIQAMRTSADASDTGFYGPSGQTTPVSGRRPLVIG